MLRDGYEVEQGSYGRDGKFELQSRITMELGRVVDADKNRLLVVLSTGEFVELPQKNGRWVVPGQDLLAIADNIPLGFEAESEELVLVEHPKGRGRNEDRQWTSLHVFSSVHKTVKEEQRQASAHVPTAMPNLAERERFVIEMLERNALPEGTITEETLQALGIENERTLFALKTSRGQ